MNNANQMRRGRRQNRRRPNRRVIPRQRVALSNNRIANRVLRATTRVFLQFPNPNQGGVEGSFAFSNPVQDYVGSDFVRDNFEQYKVTRVKVLMKPSSATLNNGLAPSTTQESIKYQNSVYSLMNNTEVQSFVDYDSDLAPTYNECLTRPNLRMRALMPNNWTTIAQYSPKSLSNPSNTAGVPSITFSSAQWMTTNNLTTTLRGLRGRVSNRSPLFDGQTNVASVDVMFAISVSMRGFKNTLGATPIPPLPFETRTEEDIEEEQDPLRPIVNLKFSGEPIAPPFALHPDPNTIEVPEVTFTAEEEKIIDSMSTDDVLVNKPHVAIDMPDEWPAQTTFDD